MFYTATVAQITFQKTFGGPNTDIGYSVQQTVDGGYIVAGYTLSFGVGNRDVLLILTDVNGNTLWTKTYGGSNTDYALTVRQTTDRGFIIGAHSESFGAGSHDVYVIKSDPSGEIIWSKVYGGSSADGAYSIQQTKDGGYIISAHTSSFGAGQHDIYLIKTDSNGDTLWTKTYGGSGGDFLRDVHQTSDSGYILVAETLSFGVGQHDIYLVKTDERGNILWSKTYGGGSSDYGYSVTQTTDGGYIIAGYTKSFGAGMSDVLLVKIDGSGDISWAKTYGGSSSDYGYSVLQTSDGGYIVAGYTESYGLAGDVYLVKTDSNGNHQWSRTFGGAGKDLSWSVQQSADGGFIITGYTTSFGSGNQDVYLIKTDELGISGCNESTVGTITGDAAIIVNSTQTLIGSGAFIDGAATITTGPVTVDSLLCSNFPTNINRSSNEHNPHIERTILFKNYPNPFNPITTINYELPQLSKVQFSIYDLTGNEVTRLIDGEQSAGHHQVTWDASDVASGIYFYRLQASPTSVWRAGDFVQTRKMLLLK